MIIQTLNNCSTAKAGFIRPKEIIKKKKMSEPCVWEEEERRNSFALVERVN